MDIFLSWSGERSRKAAEAFHRWLPDVLQSVRPWMSSEDICSGSGWNQQIRDALNKSNFGIVFVTRDNQNSDWLMFEAGALAKHVELARVVPLIVDDELKPAMLAGPLGQLQAREVTEEKIRRLIIDINFNTEARLSEERVNRCFESNWQRLKDSLDKLPPPTGDKPQLDQSAMLEQILGILRSGSQKNQTVIIGTARENNSEKMARKRLNLRLDSLDASAHFRQLVHDHWEAILPSELQISFTDDNGDEVVVHKSGDVRIQPEIAF